MTYIIVISLVIVVFILLSFVPKKSKEIQTHISDLNKNLDKLLSKSRQDDGWFDEYLNNKEQIEKCWKLLRSKNGWTQKNRDELWRLGILGREHFNIGVLTMNIGSSRFNNVSCYQRPIMLLKMEKRYQHGIPILDEAIRYGINDKFWYKKNLEQFKRKVNTSD